MLRMKNLAVLATLFPMTTAGCTNCPNGPTPEQAMAAKKMEVAPSDSIVRMAKMLLSLRHNPDGTISAATCHKYPGGLFMSLCGNYYIDEVVTPDSDRFPELKRRCQEEAGRTSG